ncbi:RDD family protein [Arthrobacter sp. H14]|uniref:RDD family protein n=1 Tax=Arthrobacter sp. H14 TaxID=1312959 RepID=UPI00047BC400|nr:RDD family protein [Arthrobacter sp. H14]
MSSIVTGEAVVLELRPASFAARGLGVLIDIAAQIAIFFAGFYVVGEAVSGSLDSSASRALILAGAVLVLVIMPITVETLTRGKSLGKLVMGLRIVRDDGGAIRFRHALLRALLAILEIYMLFGSVAIIVSMLNDRSKRLGDMLAGTYSMRERLPPTPVLQFSTPAHLQQWASLADIGRLPDPLARRISQFLHQEAKMTPASRAQLAETLANEAAGHVSPAPPAGTAPQEFLSALMSERRDRDFTRLTTQRQRSERLGERLHRLPFHSR